MMTGPASGRIQTVIARNPSLTDQVKAHLKDTIVKGGFDDGRIPSENELAAELGVSRTTVREALARLEHEGTVYRKQGAGTFVNEPGLQIKSRLEEIWSYEAVLRDHGYTPSVQVLSVTTDAAEQSVADDLAIDSDHPIVTITKLFLEDDEPVVLTINRIPTQYLLHDVTNKDDEPLYEFIEAHCGRRFAYFLSEIVPVALSEHQADQLGVAPGTPAICFEETGFDQDNAPVVRATSYFRDDLLRFRMIRRKSGV